METEERLSHRLTLHGKCELDAAIERITAGRTRDNGHQRRAVERLVLDRVRQMDAGRRARR